MDKSLMIFIAVGVGFLYFITNFIGGIQAEDDNYQNSEYKEKNKYKQYDSLDSIGQNVLDVTGANAAVQTTAWNKSPLRVEFLRLFPDFSEMKIFVKERVRGEILTKKLNTLLNDVEDAYFSGSVDSEQAKRMLSLLK